ELGSQCRLRRPDQARQGLVLLRRAKDAVVHVCGGAVLEQEPQQPERLDVRTRLESAGDERTHTDGRPNSSYLAGDAAKQARGDVAGGGPVLGSGGRAA